MGRRETASVCFTILCFFVSCEAYLSDRRGETTMIEIVNTNTNQLHCDSRSTPSPFPPPPPPSCASGFSFSLTTPGNYTITNNRNCRRINVTLCGGGGWRSPCSILNDAVPNGGGGAACASNITLSPASLPASFEVTVGAGGRGESPIGGTSFVFTGTSFEISAEGGRPGDGINGGSGGGFPSLPGGDGGAEFGSSIDGGDGMIRGPLASGGGGGAGAFYATGGNGGWVGTSRGGLPSHLECCSGNRDDRCLGGGGASLLGRGASFESDAGIGGGASLFGEPGDGAVFIIFS